MRDDTRAHERVLDEPLHGVEFRIDGVLPEPVTVFIPGKVALTDSYDVLIHFHGSAFIANTAVSRLDRPCVAVNVNLGAGSSVYETPFFEESTFHVLMDGVRDSLRDRGLGDAPTPKILLSAFSAGYGAVRAILRHGSSEIDGVLLLDGLHTDYVPDRVVLSEGGKLEASKMKPFVDFARRAVAGEKRFLMTHSEIFPGTFASTTETADFILSELGLERTPILAWGPAGMQMLSRTTSGRFAVLGFAGNSAPDHVDHFHGLPAFLKSLVEE